MLRRSFLLLVVFLSVTFSSAYGLIGVKMVVLLGIRLYSHLTSSTNSVLNEAEDETILMRSCLAGCWRVAVYQLLVVSHWAGVCRGLVVCWSLVGY